MKSYLGVLATIAIASGGCDSLGRLGDGGFIDNGGPDASAIVPSHPDGGKTPPNTGNTCTGYFCTQNCGEMATTTISGTVYDPAGRNPLYNVVVYVPNSKPKAIPMNGASCDSCSSLYTGDPVTVALTDAAGKFKLTKAPYGKNIPLVLQIGKWRKQVVIPSATACQDNPIADKTLRLPANQKEGDIPNIAISTGALDSLECLLVRVGLSASEFVGGPSGPGRIHIFAGGKDSGFFGSGAPNTSPAGPVSSSSLWTSQASLMPFDMVILSCEGSETYQMNQPALHAYANAGGRVFASHFHYAWFNTGPFGSENLATWKTNSQDIGDINAQIVTSFPKGKALNQWLGNVGALSNGELPIQQARHNADVSMSNTPSRTWILADQNAPAPGATEYLSFETPTNASKNDAGVPNFCGRVVFSDLHVGAASGDYGGLGLGGAVVPDGCTNNDLSPQEKALEFMLFDLSSCVTPDNAPTEPPIM